MSSTVIGEAFVEVKPKTDGFEHAAQGGVEKGLGSIAKKAAVVFGTALATGAAVHFVGGFVKAAAESQKISRVTDAIIKSTGGAAQLSADQVGNLATSLSNLSGVDDEVVQSAENILLTFTNVRNEVGAGNNIFDRTTEAALNMAAVLGGDPTSSIQQLGKALNDPAAGLTKLAKSGVVFTDQQKDQVKALQASGDLLGAQKVILQELDKEFGGAAAAAADPFDRLTVAAGNLQEAIGGALIPVIAPAATALANFINEHQGDIANDITAAFDALGDVIDFLKPGAENLATAFTTLKDAVGPVIDKISTFVTDHLPSLSGALEENTPLVEGLSTAIVTLAGALGTLAVAGAIGAQFGGLFSILGTLGSLLGGLAAVVPHLVTVLGVLASPVAVIAAAFVAAAAAGEALYQLVPPITDAFDSLFGTLAPFAAALTFLNPFVPLAVAAKFLYDNVAPVRAVIQAVIERVEALFFAGKKLVDQLDIGGAITGALSGIGDVISGALDSIDLSGVADAIGSGLSTALSASDAVAGAFDSITSAITSGLAPAVEFLTGLWAQYGDQVTGILVGFRDIAVAVFNRVIDLFNLLRTVATPVFLEIGRLFGVFVDQLANLASVARGLIGPAFEFIGAVVEIAFSPLKTIIGGALDFIQIAFSTFVGVVGPMWSALWGLVTDVVSNVVEPIRAVIEGFLTIIQGFVDVVAGIFTGDWSRIWDGLSEVASGALEIVQGILDTFLGFLAAVWSNATTLLTLPFTTAWTIIQGAVSGGVTIVQTLLQGALDFVGSVWSNLSTLLLAPVEAGRVLIQGVITGIVGLFSALPGQVTSALSSLASSIAGVITGAAASAILAAAGVITEIVTEIGKLPAKAVDAIVTLGSSLAGAIKSAAVSAVVAAGNLVVDVVSKIGELPGKIVGALGDIGGAVKDAIVGSINFVIDKFNSLSDIDTPFGTFGLPDIPRIGLAVGGIVPGPTGKPVPAVVHAGEVVLNPVQQAQLLWNLARRDLGPGTGDSSVVVDARFINEGTIWGVSDLDARLDEHYARVVDGVRNGRR